LSEYFPKVYEDDSYRTIPTGNSSSKKLESDDSRYVKEPPRYRPSLDRYTSSFIKKNFVAGLHDSEIEAGEVAITVCDNIRCEHNFQDLENDVVGTLLLTNFKLLLKPAGISKDMKVFGRARVQAYFVITLG
jgi:hypothetical protein